MWRCAQSLSNPPVLGEGSTSSFTSAAIVENSFPLQEKTLADEMTSSGGRRGRRTPLHEFVKTRIDSQPIRYQPCKLLFDHACNFRKGFGTRLATPYSVAPLLVIQNVCLVTQNSHSRSWCQHTRA